MDPEEEDSDLKEEDLDLKEGLDSNKGSDLKEKLNSDNLNKDKGGY